MHLSEDYHLPPTLLNYHLDNHNFDFKKKKICCNYGNLCYRRTFSDHNARHHAAKNLKCPHCSHCFARKAFLTEHIRQYHILCNLVCKFCKKVSSNLKTLTQHLLFVHDYRIDTAQDIIFADTSKEEEGPEPVEGPLAEDRGPSSDQFVCSECPKSFPTKKKLYQHTILMHAEKNILCTFCGERFSRPYCLRRHIKNYHHRVTDVKCPHCPDVLSTEKTLYFHIRIMHKDKRYQCKLCKEGFPLKDDLKGHMLANHKEWAVFSCDECTEEFDTMTKLRRHCVSVHKIRFFRCVHCDQSFTTNQHLRRHLRMTHQIYEGDAAADPDLKVSCSHCLKEFHSSWHLRRHIASSHLEEGVYCRICYHVFESNGSLKLHMDSAHPGVKFECDICKKEFSTKWHLKRHNDNVHNQTEPDPSGSKTTNRISPRYEYFKTFLL